MVHRELEEPLNLLRMQVKADNSAGTRFCQQIGDKTCSDRLARRDFFVLAGLAIVGKHTGYACSTWPPEGTQEKHKCHEGFIYRVSL